MVARRSASRPSTARWAAGTTSRPTSTRAPRPTRPRARSSPVGSDAGFHSGLCNADGRSARLERLTAAEQGALAVRQRQAVEDGDRAVGAGCEGGEDLAVLVLGAAALVEP